MTSLHLILTCLTIRVNFQNFLRVEDGFSLKDKSHFKYFQTLLSTSKWQGYTKLCLKLCITSTKMINCIKNYRIVWTLNFELFPCVAWFNQGLIGKRKTAIKLPRMQLSKILERIKSTYDVQITKYFDHSKLILIFRRITFSSILLMLLNVRANVSPLRKNILIRYKALQTHLKRY